MVSVKWARRCVSRAVKATGHAVWLSLQYQGYIMAMGYLPADETQGLVNPVTEEFQLSHS